MGVAFAFEFVFEVASELALEFAFECPFVVADLEVGSVAFFFRGVGGSAPTLSSCHKLRFSL
jgi:hypothetical protein